jgi:hypothetical protein
MFKPGVGRYPDSGALTFSFSGCQAFDTDRPHRVPLCQPLPAIWKPGREFEKDVKKTTSEPVNSLKTNRRLRETNSKRTPTEAENSAAKTRNGPDKIKSTFSLSEPMPRSMMPHVEFKRDVKIVGTNSISYLESIKSLKNELKANSK